MAYSYLPHVFDEPLLLNKTEYQHLTICLHRCTSHWPRMISYEVIKQNQDYTPRYIRGFQSRKSLQRENVKSEPKTSFGCSEWFVVLLLLLFTWWLFFSFLWFSVLIQFLMFWHRYVSPIHMLVLFFLYEEQHQHIYGWKISVSKHQNLNQNLNLKTH